MECAEPSRDCPLCPRLAAFRESNRTSFPDFFNAPVPSFGDAEAQLLIVGLAPGLRGANRTGRPFTGDYAGQLLYSTLLKFGLASGEYLETPADGLRLQRCMITNAVRCVPPANKPEPSEINICRHFLTQRIGVLPKLRAIVVLGRIAHDSTLRALGLKLAAFPFRHGASHAVPGSPVRLFDSYHCSRYNTNTGMLTPSMFETVFKTVRTYLEISNNSDVD
ncbi:MULTISPECIES: uracil-DNA glycosylase [Rhodomicrobium]|nr:MULTISPECIES: uracil-DNA glycosylase [Rhodomicrobium]